METTLTITKTYCGPPNSGNGGYTAGLIASFLDFAPQITLRLPPPLDEVLRLNFDHQKAELYSNTQLIAEAIPTEFDLDPPDLPAFDSILNEENLEPYPPHHNFPNCYVCGPNRQEGDGLRIFARKIIDGDIVVSLWKPDPQLSNSFGTVKEPFIWAALDCPGAFTYLKDGLKLVLGRISTKLLKPLSVEETYIVAGWPLGNEGRKYHTGTGIFSVDHELLAIAKSTWISIP